MTLTLKNLNLPLTSKFKNITSVSNIARLVKLIPISLIILVLYWGCGAATPNAGSNAGNPVLPIPDEPPPIEVSTLAVTLGLDPNVEVESYYFDSNVNTGIFTLATFTNVASSEEVTLAFTIPAQYEFLPPLADEYIIDQDNSQLATVAVFALSIEADEEGMLDLATFLVRRIDMPEGSLYTYIVKAQYVLPSQSVVSQSFTVTLEGSEPNIRPTDTPNVFEAVDLTNRDSKDTTIIFRPPDGYEVVSKTPDSSSPHTTYVHVDSDGVGTGAIPSADLVTFVLENIADPSQTTPYTLRAEFVEQTTVSPPNEASQLLVNYGGQQLGQDSPPGAISFAEATATYTVTGLTNRDNPSRTIEMLAFAPASSSTSKPLFTYDASGVGLSLDTAGHLTIAQEAFTDPAGTGAINTSVPLASFTVQERLYPANQATYTIEAAEFAAQIDVVVPHISFDYPAVPGIIGPAYRVDNIGTNNENVILLAPQQIIPFESGGTVAFPASTIPFIYDSNVFELINVTADGVTNTNAIARTNIPSVGRHTLASFAMRELAYPSNFNKFQVEATFVDRGRFEVDHAGRRHAVQAVAGEDNTFEVLDLTNRAREDLTITLFPPSGFRIVSATSTTSTLTQQGSLYTLRDLDDSRIVAIPAAELVTFVLANTADPSQTTDYTLRAAFAAQTDIVVPDISFAYPVTPGTTSSAYTTVEFGINQSTIILVSRQNIPFGGGGTVVFPAPTLPFTYDSNTFELINVTADGVTNTNAIARTNITIGGFYRPLARFAMREIAYPSNIKYFQVAATFTEQRDLEIGANHAGRSHTVQAVTGEDNTFEVLDLTNRADEDLMISLLPPSGFRIVSTTPPLVQQDLFYTLTDTDGPGIAVIPSTTLITFTLENMTNTAQTLSYIIKGGFAEPASFPPAPEVSEVYISYGWSNSYDPSFSVTLTGTTYTVTGLTNRDGGIGTVIISALIDPNGDFEYDSSMYGVGSNIMNGEFIILSVAFNSPDGNMAVNEEFTLATFRIQESDYTNNQIDYTIKAASFVAQVPVPVPTIGFTYPTSGGTSYSVGEADVDASASGTETTVLRLPTDVSHASGGAVEFLAPTGYDALLYELISLDANGLERTNSLTMTNTASSGDQVVASFTMREIAYSDNATNFEVRATFTEQGSFDVNHAGRSHTVQAVTGEDNTFEVLNLTNRADEDMTITFLPPSGFSVVSTTPTTLTQQGSLYTLTDTDGLGIDEIPSATLATFMLENITDSSQTLLYILRGGFAEQVTPPPAHAAADVLVAYGGSNSIEPDVGITLTGTTYTVTGLTNRDNPPRRIEIPEIPFRSIFEYDASAEGVSFNADGTLTITEAAFADPVGTGAVIGEFILATFRVQESNYTNNQIEYTIKAASLAAQVDPVVRAEDFVVTLAGSSPVVQAVVGEDGVFEVLNLTNRRSENVRINFSPPSGFTVMRTVPPTAAPFTSYTYTDEYNFDVVRAVSDFVTFTIADDAVPSLTFQYTVRGGFVAPVAIPIPTISFRYPLPTSTVYETSSNSGSGDTPVSPIILRSVPRFLPFLINGSDVTFETPAGYDTDIFELVTLGANNVSLTNTLPATSVRTSVENLQVDFQLREKAFTTNTKHFRVHADFNSAPTVNPANFVVSMEGSTPSVGYHQGSSAYLVSGLTNRANEDITVSFTPPAGYGLSSTSSPSTTVVTDPDNEGTGYLELLSLATFKIEADGNPDVTYEYTLSGTLLRQEPVVYQPPHSSLTVNYGGSNGTVDLSLSSIYDLYGNPSYYVDGLTNRDDPDRSIEIGALANDKLAYDVTASGYSSNAQNALVIAKDGFTDPVGVGFISGRPELASFTIHEVAYPKNSKTYGITGLNMSAQEVINVPQSIDFTYPDTASSYSITTRTVDTATAKATFEYLDETLMFQSSGSAAVAVPPGHDDTSLFEVFDAEANAVNTIAPRVIGDTNERLLADFMIREKSYPSNQLAIEVYANFADMAATTPVVFAANFTVTMQGSTPAVIAVAGSTTEFEVYNLTNRANKPVRVQFRLPLGYRLASSSPTASSDVTIPDSDGVLTVALSDVLLATFVLENINDDPLLPTFTYTLRGDFLAQGTISAPAVTDLTVTYGESTIGGTGGGITLAGSDYTVMGLTNRSDPERRIQIASLGQTGFRYDTSAIGYFMHASGSIAIIKAGFLDPPGVGAITTPLELATFTVRETAYPANSQTYTISADQFAAQAPIAAPALSFTYPDTTGSYGLEVSGESSEGLVTYQVTGNAPVTFGTGGTVAFAAPSGYNFTAYEWLDGTTRAPYGNDRLPDFIVPSASRQPVAHFIIRERAYPLNEKEFIVYVNFEAAGGATRPSVTAADFDVMLDGSSPTVVETSAIGVFEVNNLTNRANKNTIVRFTEPSGYVVSGSGLEQAFTDSDGAGTGALSIRDLVTFTITNTTDPTEAFVYTLRGSFAAQSAPEPPAATGMVVNYGGSNLAGSDGAITYSIVSTNGIPNVYAVTGMTNRGNPSRSITVPALAQVNGASLFEYDYDASAVGYVQDTAGRLTIGMEGFSDPDGVNAFNYHGLAKFSVREKAYHANSVKYTIQGVSIQSQPHISGEITASFAYPTPTDPEVALTNAPIDNYNTILSPPSLSSGGYFRPTFQSNGNITLTVTGYNTNVFQLASTDGTPLLSPFAIPVASPGAFEHSFRLQEIDYPANGHTFVMMNFYFARDFPDISASFTYTTSSVTSASTNFSNYDIPQDDTRKFYLNQSVDFGGGGTLAVTLSAYNSSLYELLLETNADTHAIGTTPVTSLPASIPITSTGLFEYHFELREIANPDNKKLHIIELYFELVTEANFSVTLEGSSPVVRFTSDPYVYQVNNLTNGVSQDTTITFTPPSGYSVVASASQTINIGGSASQIITDSDGIGTGAIPSRDLATFTIVNTTNSAQTFVYTVRGAFAAPPPPAAQPLPTLTASFTYPTTAASPVSLVNDPLGTTPERYYLNPPSGSAAIPYESGSNVILTITGYDTGVFHLVPESDPISHTIGTTAISSPITIPVTRSGTLQYYFELQQIGNPQNKRLYVFSIGLEDPVVRLVSAANFQVTLEGSAVPTVTRSDNDPFIYKISDITNRASEDMTITFTPPSGYQILDPTPAPVGMPVSYTVTDSDGPGTGAISRLGVVTFELADSTGQLFYYEIDANFAAQADLPALGGSMTYPDPSAASLSFTRSAGAVGNTYLSLANIDFGSGGTMTPTLLTYNTTKYELLVGGTPMTSLPAIPVTLTDPTSGVFQYKFTLREKAYPANIWSYTIHITFINVPSTP